MSLHKDDPIVEALTVILAYHQCRRLNPLADDPQVGYLTFSEEQREYLRDEQREAAYEIAQIIKAREAEAWDEGSAYGISFQAGGSWVANPYRIEASP